MKKIFLTSLMIFSLVSLKALAADAPSAEELDQMNKAVAEIKALIAASPASTVLHSMAAMLATSTDPEAVSAAEKIEGMADAISASSSSGGTTSMGSPHGGSSFSSSSGGSTSLGSPHSGSSVPSTTTPEISSTGLSSISRPTASTKTQIVPNGITSIPAANFGIATTPGSDTYATKPATSKITKATFNLWAP